MQLLCPPRVRSNGLLVVALGLLLPTCGDGGGNSGLGPARNGGAGGGGGVGGVPSGQGGASGALGGASGQGGAAGGSLDAGGGGADTGGGTGPATIKFCNTLVIGDGAQVADTTIELTVGTVKLTSTTNGCSPPAPMPCTSVTAGANRVVMNVIDPPMATPLIYDKMMTFNAGTAYLVLSTFDETAMAPSVISEPFPPNASCANFVPPPTPMKFCNRFFRGTTALSLDLEVAGLKFTAMSGTCAPALNQACVAVPSGGQTLTLKEGATVLATATLALVPTVQSIIHASPVNNMPVLGGLELPETSMCSMVDYTAVDTFLKMNPPMPYQPMKKVAATPGPASRLNTPSGWKIMAGPSRFALPPLR